jgi:hypothetical protein
VKLFLQIPANFASMKISDQHLSAKWDVCTWMTKIETPDAARFEEDDPGAALRAARNYQMCEAGYLNGYL